MSPRIPVALRRVVRPLEDFIGDETSGGMLLLAATLAALLWANLANSSYQGFWSQSANIDLGLLELHLDARHWVNDALMALFFFVVTLEIRREFTRGELQGRTTAALPVAAALGGMVVPAGLYLLINAGQGSLRGWGIPMATDIAFALGVLALLGKRVPISLRAFLLALAIVDDIGGIAVIALVYTDDLSLPWLAAAAMVAVAAWALASARFEAWVAYGLLGVIAWYAVYQSGVHATIAGVALAFVIPQASDKRATIHRAEDQLHPWTSLLVVPLFALANAGILLRPGILSDAISSPVALGAATGLIVGKPVGVVLFAAIAVKMGIAKLPERVRWTDMLGVAFVAGIGFTVAIFISTLAFDDAALVEEAKLGVLVASVLAAFVGVAWLKLMSRTAPS